MKRYRALLLFILAVIAVLPATAQFLSLIHI